MGDGRIIYPQSVDFFYDATTESATLTNASYDQRNYEFTLGNAFTDVSVTPNLLSVDLDKEHDGDSAIFTEIRQGPHTGQISTKFADNIINRIYPTTSTSLTALPTNKENTPSFKVKICDSSVPPTTTNKLVTYSTSDFPDSNIGLNIENYDYFILLNPDIYNTSTREDTVRSHFAKITRITTFDTFGDGVEFEPNYSGTITKGTKIEIFKGPPKTETDIVAVSYGLRGNTTIASKKFDERNVVSIPTFYFYNDRLEEKNQLDYNEKYTLCSCRWWNTLQSLSASTGVTMSQYERGSTSTSKYIQLTNSTEYGKVVEGMSIFTSTGTYLGNIERKYATNKIYLDFARVGISSGITAFTYGNTIQNIVFKTQRKYGDTIQNLGRNKLDAVLVDNLRTTDDYGPGFTSFDPIYWHEAFPNMKRHEEDHTLTYDESTHTIADSGHRKMNGPSRYITFESAQFKNDKLPVTMESHVNNPMNKISRMAGTLSIDNSGTHSLKYKSEDEMVIRKQLFANSFSLKTLLHTVTSSANVITINGLTDDFDYASILSDYATDNTLQRTIVKIEDYYYVVNDVSSRDYATSTQTFTVSYSKLKGANIWTSSNVVHSFTSAELLVVPWSNSKFNIEFKGIDTEVKHNQNNRLTIDNHTVDKKNTLLYNARISLGGFVGHEVKIDYGDKSQQYLTIQESNRVFYQKTPISRMYYYNGGYSLQKENFIGNVEDVVSSNKNGLMEHKIHGRDKISKLLSNDVNTNMNFTDDIIYSTLNPKLSLIQISDTDIDTDITSVTVGVDGSTTFGKYTLLFDSNKKLIGEVSSTEYLSGFDRTTITLLDKAYIGITNGTSYYYYNPFTEANYLSGIKALSSNSREINKTTDFESVSDKGLVFHKGNKLTLESNTLVKKTLELLSNDGYYDSEKRTLGFNISNNTSFFTDSAGLLKLSKEDDATVTTQNMHTYNSQMFTVVNEDSPHNNITTLKMAPIFPVVLGRIDDNTNNTDTNSRNIYLVNNSIPSGAILHRMNTNADNFYTSTQMIRYYDSHNFNTGTINYDYTISISPTYNHSSIYDNGNKSQKIIGYSRGYSVDYEGDSEDCVISKDSYPIKQGSGRGTNLINSDGTDGLNGHIPKQTVHEAAGGDIVSIWEEITNIDYRTTPYEFLSTGDIFPNSYLRYNNISNSLNYFKDYGILLESNSNKKGTNLSHSNYVGKTFPILKTDENFELSSISSSTINSNDLKRFGAIRLVEATFDWHFNSVDAEQVKSGDKLDVVNLSQYPRFTYDATEYTLTDMTSSSITFSSSASFIDGDFLYNKDSGEILAKFTGTVSGTTISSNFTRLITTGDISSASIVTFKTRIIMSERYSDETYGLDGPYLKSIFIAGLNLTNVHLVSPNISRDYFSYGNLDGTTSANPGFEPHNVFLPVWFGSIDVSLSSGAEKSGFHCSQDLSSISIPVYHPSKVLNSMVVHRQTSAFARDTVHHFHVKNYHAYNNCIGIFKSFNPGLKRTSSQSSGDTKNNIQTITSSPLALDTKIPSDVTEQHAPNMLLMDATDGFDVNPNLFLAGTRTTKYILQDHLDVHTVSGDFTDSGNAKHTDHSDGNGNVFNAQMFIKPVFDLDDSYDDVSDIVDGNTITINLGEQINYNWITFLPSLEGYYLVRETDESNNTFNTSVVSDILKIKSHTVTTASDFYKHTIEVDKTPTVNKRYRLMRISETTFEDTPNYIDFYKPFDIGLQYDFIPQNFASGDVSTGKNQYQEGIFSMYMLMDIDRVESSGTTYLDRRTIATAINSFTNGDVLECCITDGNTTDVKTISVTANATNLKFEYDGKLNGNGIVSFGEVFEITLPRKVNLNNITTAHIGNTFSIGSIVETEIANIVKDAGLDLDVELSFKQYTGAIVASTPNGNIITCVEAPDKIEANDIIYNQEGYLIGKVASVNGGNKTVTMDSIIFVPSQWDELTKKDKKTHVSIANFNSADSFSAVNYLATRRGLDYKIENELLSAKNIDDYYSLRQYPLGYKINNNLISVESNKSMFDRANRIIVIGDGVKTEVDASDGKQVRVLRHTDTNIKTENEGKIVAEHLLDVHNQDTRKIKLKLQKEGLELLQPGDILALDFPNHDIPRDDYRVFEIEDELAGITTVSVGTFNKTIAERLSSIESNQMNFSISQYAKNSSSSSMRRTIKSNVNINNVSIEYEVKSTSGGNPSGFTNTLGFGLTLGFGDASTTILKSYKSEKDV